MPSMSAARPRYLTWALHAINATVVVGVSLRAAMVWDRLPDRVPMHFNYAGEVDRWAAKSAGFGILFVMPWLIAGLLYGLRAAMGAFARRPELVNLPPSLKGLPPERLAPFFEAVRDLLLWAATAACLTLGSLAYGTLQVALGRAKALEGWFTPQIWLGVLVAAVGLGLVRMMVVATRLGRR